MTRPRRGHLAPPPGHADGEDQPEVFDTGLQPERTALAWRRTCLALALASLAGARFAAVVVGPGAYVLGAAGLLTALGCCVSGESRHRRTHTRLTAAARRPPGGDHVGLPDGRALVVVAGLMELLALGGACFEVLSL